MARANTFAMEKSGYMFSKDRPCAICGATPEYRAFFYPTYMNGDAEFLGDYCPAHKGTNLRDVAFGKIPLLYALEDYPNVPVKIEDVLPEDAEPADDQEPLEDDAI